MKLDTEVLIDEIDWRLEFDHKFKFKSSGYDVTESSTVELQVVQQGRPSSKNTKLYKVDLTQD